VVDRESVYFSLSAATPGSTLPSSSSSDAPPPEWEKRERKREKRGGKKKVDRREGKWKEGGRRER
jgi:hypothetical protein